MSTLTFGPTVSLELPPPSPPPFNLLTVASELSASLDGEGGFDPHWRGGGELWLYPPELTSGEDPCATGSLDEKAEAEEAANPTFGAFTVYQPIVCSTFGTRDFAELQRRANAALAAHEANAAERQLVGGEFKDDNPYLGDANLDALASGAAVSPATGLELLEQAGGEKGEAFVIHATPDVIAAWAALGNALRIERDRIVTFGGTPVVRGTGYQGHKPDGKANPDANQAWAFASGVVGYRRSEEIHFGPPELSQALEREQNRIVYRAERDYLVVFDPVVQAGALIDRSL